jgi:hydrogenase/urease accessory protein HupE
MEGLRVMTRPVQKLGMMAIGALALPAAAHAHLTGTGLGPFYDGVTHFFLSPEEVIPALALALFAGLRGARCGRLALFLLPGAWLVGGLAGLAFPVAGQFTLLTSVSFLVLGALVATDARVEPRIVAGLALGFGGVVGFVNGADLSSATLGAVGVLGSAAALFVLVALAAALVTSLSAPWTRMVVRVAGSWIVAAGLLLLGWNFHRRVAKLQTESSVKSQTLPTSAKGPWPESQTTAGTLR